MIEILIAWKEIACQGVVSGLCCPGPRSAIYFFPDDRRFRSSFLRVFHGEHMREREFVPQTLASGPTNNSRVDSRHSAGSPYFKPRYVVFIHAIFHFASYKPQRSYSRDAHAMRNFPVANTLRNAIQGGISYG